MTDDEQEQLRSKIEQKSNDLAAVAKRLITCDEMIDQLTKENLELRIGGARVTHALDCALQLTEVLIAFLPEGQPVHPGLETAKGALAQALKELRR